ncbi:MAG: Ig domain-containing protein [Intestinimonas sp.]
MDGVTLDRDSLSLEVGRHETLHATVSPSSAFDQDLSWYSSNTGVAEVSNGRVTALSPGEADITVTTDDGGFTASCHVIVTAAVPVTGVRLDRTELTLTKDGESATLKATVSPLTPPIRTSLDGGRFRRHLGGPVRQSNRRGQRRRHCHRHNCRRRVHRLLYRPGAVSLCTSHPLSE